MIKHESGSWNVYNKAGTKKLGSHPNKAKAMAQLRAIEISKHKNEPGATQPKKKKQLGSY